MNEAFIYLWYDALNKMFYLGSSIGKDPNYAHSSSVMESFTMKTKPAYMHRKKLAFGTYEEILALESKLQTNRKNRIYPNGASCWDRYYNDYVCDGLYNGFGSGENNPNWKGGLWTNDPKAYMKAYGTSPERKAVRKKSDAKRRAKNKKETGWTRGCSQATPEKRARRAKNKEKTGFTMGYSQATPEHREYHAKWRAKNKNKVVGEGTLEAFL